LKLATRLLATFRGGRRSEQSGSDASQNAVWGQLRGHRGGGIDLSFVRAADQPSKGPPRWRWRH
jgi:hypothetical protein